MYYPFPDIAKPSWSRTQKGAIAPVRTTGEEGGLIVKKARSASFSPRIFTLGWTALPEADYKRLWGCFLLSHGCGLLYTPVGENSAVKVVFAQDDMDFRIVSGDRRQGSITLREIEE